jgi:hypothetical protein
VPTRYELVRTLFTEAATDLGNVRPDAGHGFWCPLCLRAFKAADVDSTLLSIEHVIPSALGGHALTLTCTSCNTKQGSSIDKHLVQMMATMDALEGHGVIRAELHNDTGRVTANIGWRSGEPGDPREIRIVGKASNPAGVTAIRDMIGPGAELRTTLNFDFIPQQYWRAVVRAGYLSLFSHFGYAYALSHGGAQVRRILDGASPPSSIILDATPSMELPNQVLIASVPEIKTAQFYVVVLRLCRRTTRHLAVFLPGDDGTDWDRFAQFTSQPSQLQMQTELEGGNTVISFRFNKEPVQLLREAKFSSDWPRIS